MDWKKFSKESVKQIKENPTFFVISLFGLFALFLFLVNLFAVKNLNSTNFIAVFINNFIYLAKTLGLSQTTIILFCVAGSAALAYYKRFKLSITILLLCVVFIGVNVRLANLPLLKDSTNGEYLPLALDPLYFMRVAQTRLATNNNLPQYDPLRVFPGGNIAWHPEIMPELNVFIFKVASNFISGIDIRFIAVISPVIYFFFAILLFYILIFKLTKNKGIALLATLLLSVIPAYLYRTMTGFADHESIGMLAFYLTFIAFVYALSNINNKKVGKVVFASFFVGLTTTLTIAMWTGISSILFVLYPFTFFFVWLFNTKKESKVFVRNGLTFYIGWIIFTVITGLFFKYSPMGMLNFFLGSQSIISIAVLGFMVVDAIFIYTKPKFVKKNKRLFYSLGVTIILGVIVLPIIGIDLVGILRSSIVKFLTPWNTSRLNITVAENKQPYLQDWIGTTGKVIFWMFISGAVLFGIRLARKIKNLKKSTIFFILYILMIFGIVFSRISPTSTLNGESFASSLVYFIPLIAFWVYFFKIYMNEDFKFTGIQMFIFSWLFLTIVTGRAAIRMFFAITPFVSFMAAYFIIGIFEETRRAKDEILKMILIVIFTLIVILTFNATAQAYLATSNQAKNTGPSANFQWQNAMSWVRTNTAEDSVFVHWWDYGYWVQTLGERATIADGGHFQGAYNGDHKIGRYVLTNQDPNAALSFFKSMQTDYLLIDQTDLGKYSAYSLIGSDAEWDRRSAIPAAVYDPKQTRETNKGIVFSYVLNSMVDEDLVYQEGNSSKIFIPGPSYDVRGNAFANAGIYKIEVGVSNNSVTQPMAAYYFQGQNYNLPVRYVYINEQLFDFKKGVDSVVMVLPYFKTQGQSGNLDPFGAIIYLSPKVQKSLFAQLYLLDDAFGKYPTIKLAHEEPDQMISYLKSQGAQLNEFVFYGGLRGPIKIWDLQDIPENIQVVEEFYEYQHEQYGILDDKQFILE
ncbi:hypothetical protein GOV14_06770 [Candidatus Pacearchaeota archaeon]|nr:hypothetical protein [Candidatus Pacearchaeota archaeon]